ncbi:endonuclease III-like protein 1 isoform X1 [Scaptodrosophila lebanonensis]|uniref:Endonuclease III homolog n=2 Tax=Drosophila lebanonensis TaxID=7225 RepID=A0A6J2TLY5_DROLE|nr:endonuclease III-like protein 1 isoform X1 [Scaptodrosophila lebanonensis]
MFRILHKMSKKTEKISLARSLAKQSKIIKPDFVVSKQEQNLQDIEDLMPDAENARRYFSPIQTRKQRQQNATATAARKEVPTKKQRQSSDNSVEITTVNVFAFKKKLLKNEPPSLVRCSDVVQEFNPNAAANIKIEASEFKNQTMQATSVSKLVKIEELQDSKPLIASVKTEPTECEALIPNVASVIKSEANIIKSQVPDAVLELKETKKLGPTIWWHQHLENIRLMRSKSAAPVDTMGCHQCADENADDKTQRFHKLVALMLSSQTKDETTFQAMNRLKARTLTPANILSMPVNDLEQLVHPVSFYKNKSKYLKQTAQILLDKYDGDIPNNVKELIALPGVGPKMAHICMATAWNEVTGIGVDVHVHRISNRLGWSKSKEPEQTRATLESWLPRELWSEVNHLFVGFGQTICTPVRPNCTNCLNIDICPSADKSAKAKAVLNSKSQ